MSNYYPVSNMNMNNNSVFSSYPNSHTPQSILLPKKNKQYQNDTLHDNFRSDEFYNDKITEYIVHVDSGDRDISAFPNPFKYTVSLNKPSRVTYRSTDIHGNPISEVMEGAPNPIINKDFSNIKYIKLDRIMLPKYKVLKEDVNGDWTSFETSDFSNSIFHDRYVILKINQFSNNKVYGTNTNLDSSFGIIYPELDIGNNFFFGNTSNCKNVYRDNQLLSLDSFTVELLDSNGDLLNFRGYDLGGNYINNILDSTKSDLRNPYNTLLQNTMTLKIGVCENDHNTGANY